MNGLRFAAAVAAATGLVWVSSPRSAAAPSAADPLAAEFTIRSARITLGEPLVVTYRLRNVSPERLWLRQSGLWPRPLAGGELCMGWLRIGLAADPGGSIAPTAVRQPLITFMGPGFTAGSGAGRLDPAGAYEGCLVVSERFAIQQPGRYRLTLRANLTYGRDEAAREASVDIGRELPLTVAAGNPLRLRKVAYDLARAVRAGGPGQTDALVSLASMADDPQVVAVWRQLATDSAVRRQPRRSLVALLERHPSRTARAVARELGTIVDAEARSEVPAAP